MDIHFTKDPTTNTALLFLSIKENDELVAFSMHSGEPINTIVERGGQVPPLLKLTIHEMEQFLKAMEKFIWESKQ